MTTIARFVGLTLALIVILVVGSALGQRWLKLQSESLRADTVEAKRAQFEQLLALAPPGPTPWDDATLQKFARALGAQSLSNLSGDVRSAESSSWVFNYIPAVSDPARRQMAVRIHLTPPPAVRLSSAYQRATVVLLLLGVTLLVLLSGVVLLTSRRMRETAQPAEGNAGNLGAGMSSFARLARVSVEQGAELEHERTERVRIQEDLHFQQVLLNRALAEKIRLGHDLHDGIIQALYATGLTLEAAKSSLAHSPALAREQVETALQTLNTTIRDVRSYIMGLAPENLREQSFADSVRSITETLGAGRPVKFDLRIDPAAAGRLTEAQSTDLFQIVREAVSNSIRHGGAGEISIRLQEDGGEICLLIQDNGAGFDLAHAVRGHGLANIQTRAARLGGNARCTTSPGSGARIVVTLAAGVPVLVSS